MRRGHGHMAFQSDPISPTLSVRPFLSVRPYLAKSCRGNGHHRFRLHLVIILRGRKVNKDGEEVRVARGS